MDPKIILIIGCIAGVVIIGLIAVNVLLIRWVCKRNKDAKDAETRMSDLASGRCTAANGTRRQRRPKDDKYVTTSVTKNKKGPKKQYVNTDDLKQPKVVEKRTFGDVDVTVTDYGDGDFNTLKRGDDSNSSCEPLNDYGQVRLGMDSGEYDTAFFRNRKEEDRSDSVYAYVDKSKTKKALKSAEESEYDDPKQRKTNNDREESGSPTSLPPRGYLTKDGVQDTGYEVSWIKNENELSVNNPMKKDKQGSLRTKAPKAEIGKKKENSKHLEVKDNIYIQTEDSFLQTQKVPDLRERKSAGTQVEDMDFTLKVA